MISKYGEEFMPKRMTADSAGLDVRAPEGFTLGAGESMVVDTGLRLEDGDLRDDEFIMIVPRSGLGVRHGLRLKNTAEIIDHGYRDTIKLVVTVDSPIKVERGERIVQMIVMRPKRMTGETLTDAKRTGGFGSTGGV